MAVNLHIHPNLDKLPKFEFKQSTENSKATVEKEDKHAVDGKETSESDQKENQKQNVEEESNESFRTVAKFVIGIAVIGVAIPVAGWMFKQTAKMIREAREVGKAITGK